MEVIDANIRYACSSCNGGFRFHEVRLIKGRPFCYECVPFGEERSVADNPPVRPVRPPNQEVKNDDWANVQPAPRVMKEIDSRGQESAEVPIELRTPEKSYAGGAKLPPVSPVQAILKRLEILHLNKSRDYCGSGPDPLINYKSAAKAVGMEPWRYALGRVFEKQERIRSILALPEPEMVPALLAELQDTALLDCIVTALLKQHIGEGE